MTENELKDRLKKALAEASLGYPWLAEKLGITRCTLNNYMAKKPIPAGLRPLMEEILNKLESGQNDIISAPPLKKKRHRRTNEQIRKDIEESKRLGQEKMAIEGYDDEESIDKRWREYGQQVLDNFKKQEEESNTEYRLQGIHDMNDELEPQVSTVKEGVVFRISIPTELLEIYEHEVAHMRQMNLGEPYDSTTVELLISRAITEDARAIKDADNARPFFMDKLDAFKNKWNALNENE